MLSWDHQKTLKVKNQNRSCKCLPKLSFHFDDQNVITYKGRFLTDFYQKKNFKGRKKYFEAETKGEGTIWSVGNQALVPRLIMVPIQALSSLLKIPRTLRYIIRSRVEGMQFYIMCDIFNMISTYYIIFHSLPTMYINNNDTVGAIYSILLLNRTHNREISCQLM